MKPYNHSLLFLDGIPSWYRQRITAQRAWDLSEDHVCELWADVGWKLGVATDLGLTLDKLLEPPFPRLFGEIHNLNLTALLGGGAQLPSVKVTQITGRGQRQTSGSTSWRPGFILSTSGPSPASHFPSNRTSLSFVPLAFSTPHTWHFQMVCGPVLLRDSCLYDDSIYIFCVWMN